MTTRLNKQMPGTCTFTWTVDVHALCGYSNRVALKIAHIVVFIVFRTKRSQSTQTVSILECSCQLAVGGARPEAAAGTRTTTTAAQLELARSLCLSHSRYRHVSAG